MKSKRSKSKEAGSMDSSNQVSYITSYEATEDFIYLVSFLSRIVGP